MLSSTTGVFHRDFKWEFEMSCVRISFGVAGPNPPYCIVAAFVSSGVLGLSFCVIDVSFGGRYVCSRCFDGDVVIGCWVPEVRFVCCFARSFSKVG